MGMPGQGKWNGRDELHISKTSKEPSPRPTAREAPPRNAADVH